MSALRRNRLPERLAGLTSWARLVLMRSDVNECGSDSVSSKKNAAYSKFMCAFLGCRDGENCRVRAPGLVFSRAMGNWRDTRMGRALALGCFRLRGGAKP